jgi:hypothetical protein
LAAAEIFSERGSGFRLDKTLLQQQPTRAKDSFGFAEKLQIG